MPKNYMEDLVEDYLTGVIAQYQEICKCEHCIEDIRAIALNHLPPAYSVTARGNTYLKINQLKPQFTTDVINAIGQAAEIVAKNPRHQ